MEYYDVNHFVFNPDALIVLGGKGLRRILQDTVYYVPKDVIDDVLSNCVFLMLSEEREDGELKVPACFIPKKLIEGKSIFAFYEMLYSKGRDKQVDMILHEIAHYFLCHSGEGLSEEEYFKQEEAANDQKDKWIEGWQKDQTE